MMTISKIKVLLALLSLNLFFTGSVFAESSLPVFAYPLERVTHRTGSFGEFRRDHFHAGIDISTLGQTGWSVICPADAYISRVKVSSFGYGKALYLTTLDKKYTIVFAHLERFTSTIDRLIRKKQMISAEYFQDIYFQPGEHKVLRKDVIAYSGDTGGVFPHLHYEVRDENERPILFSIRELEKIDTKPPVMKAIAVHPLEAEAVINGRHETVIFPLVRKKNGEFALGNKKISVRGKIGISLYAYDGSRGNKLGLNHVSMETGEGTSVDVNINGFSYKQYKKLFFAYSREAYLKTKKGYLRLFSDHKGRLSYLYSGGESGIIDMHDIPRSLMIHGFDGSGNSSVARIRIYPYTQKKLDYKNDIIISKDRIFYFSEHPATARISVDGKVHEYPLEKKDEDYYMFCFKPEKWDSFRYLECRLVRDNKVIKEKNMLAVLAGPQSRIDYKGPRYVLSSDKNAMPERALLLISQGNGVSIDQEELSLTENPAFSLEPHGSAFWSPVDIGVKRVKMSGGKTGLFMDSFGNWEFYSKRMENGFLLARLMNGGLLAVLKDSVPPVIRLLKPKNGVLKNKERKIELEISDKGSGIDYSLLSVTVDGRKFPYEVRTKEDKVLVELEDKDGQRNRSVRLYIRAEDNTGNHYEKDYSILFR